MTITPANGTGNAKPNKGISITATAGKITNVAVTTGHQVVGGVLATDAKSWHTNWSLHTGAHYKVTVSAINAANKITTTTARSAPRRGRDVLGHHGRGPQPDLRRRHADHDQLQLAGHPQGGGGEGDPDQDLQAGRGRLGMGQRQGPELPAPDLLARAHQGELHGHFNGLAISPGCVRDLQPEPVVPDRQLADRRDEHRDAQDADLLEGQAVRDLAGLYGMPGDDTSNGTYVTIEGNPVLMSGPGYKNVPVFWSVRFTWSGDYYHSAPWSVGAGVRQRRHGCVNLAPNNAQWYYERAVPGDPIHHHRQPGRRRAGRRLHRGSTRGISAEPRRHPHGRADRADRQHHGRPVHAAGPGAGHVPDRVEGTQLLRGSHPRWPGGSRPASHAAGDGGRPGS